MDLNKIKISEKNFYSKSNNAYKHYLVYDYNNETMPLLIRLPEMTGHYKVFKECKTISFTFGDEELLKKHEEIFEDVSKKKCKEFSTKPSFENEYGTQKIKIHDNKTRFHNNEATKKILITDVQNLLILNQKKINIILRYS